MECRYQITMNRTVSKIQNIKSQQNGNKISVLEGDQSHSYQRSHHSNNTWAFKLWFECYDYCANHMTVFVDTVR